MTLTVEQVRANVRAHATSLLREVDAYLGSGQVWMTKAQIAAVAGYRKAMAAMLAPDADVAFGRVPWPIWPASVAPPPGIVPPVPVSME